MALRTALANPAIPDSDTLSPRGAEQWNQIIYKKIAVMGDSASAQWRLLPTTWPDVLQKRLNAAGARVEVRNFSTGGHTFFKANTTDTTYGTMTAVEAVIAYKPDVVIVELGGNDAIGSALGTGRTLAQIQSDATTTFADLAAGLPGVVLIQVNFALYDSDNFTTANTKNKGILPRWMTKKSSGILSGLDTSEYLDDTVSSTNRGILDDYEDLMTTIDAIAGVNMLSVNLFRVERLGTDMADRIHYTDFGHALISGYVIKGLSGISAFTNLVPVISEQVDGAELEDPDDLFTDYLVASGDGYVDNTPSVTGGEDTNSAWGSRRVHTDNWFMAYKGSFVLDASTYYNNYSAESLIVFSVSGAAPLVTIAVSIDGGSFSNTTSITDQKGCASGKLSVGTLSLSNASHDFRFKVGTDVYGPFALTISASPIGNVNTTSVGNSGAGEDDLMTFSVPAGVFSAAGRGIRVVQQGIFANTAAAKTFKTYIGTAVVGQTTFTQNLLGGWNVQYWCHSTGTDAQKYEGIFTVQTGASTYLPIPFNGTLTQDDGAAIVIKCTGEATNNNDIVQTFQRVYYE